MNRKTVSGIMLTLLLVNVLTLAFSVQPAKASGTIYVRADGSVEPDTALISSVDNVTYTFTDNIYDTIIIEKSNITIDGNGYILQSSGAGEGFTLSSVNNVTIINTNINNYHYGVYLSSSGGNTISNNTITSNDAGIRLNLASDNNTFSNNTITNNDDDGVYLYSSSGGNTFSNNIITSNGHGVYLSSSDDNTISNNIITNNDDGGVRLNYASGNKFSNNIITSNDAGIRLNLASDNNTISNNTITNNDDGVHLGSSSGNTISNNTITNNFYDGVHLYSFSDNTISNNTITNNEYGVRLRISSDNTISNNTITNNEYGVRLRISSDNTISNNIITNNEYGVHLASSSGNSFCHNVFVFNNVQVDTQSSVNVWDDGSKGNYWDDYGELDTNGDGIGDTPCVICANNTDRFPLVVPLGPIPVVWDEIVYSVEFMSNSTISRFQFNASQKMISFNVTGQDGTLGFCNLTIPNSLVQDLWEGNVIVLVDGKEPMNMNNWTGAKYTYIYFIYQHSEHDVIIIPEFSSFLIIPLFMMATLLVIIVYKRDKDGRKPRF